MNEFELNGKLLEVSIILGCDVYDLIEVKNEIVKNGGMNADDRHRLRGFGFPLQDRDFFTVLDEMILKLSDGEPTSTDGLINSYGRKYKKAYEKLGEELIRVYSLDIKTGANI